MLAQTSYDLNGDTRRIVPLELAEGHMLYVCELDYSDDSSHIELLSTGPGQILTNSTSLQSVIPYTYVHHATLLESGCVIAAEGVGSWPVLFKTGLDGQIQWSGYFMNSTGQTALLRVFGEGEHFTVYTFHNSDYYYQNGIYRLTGNSAGTDFSGMLVATEDPYKFRAYDVVRADGFDVVGGSGNVSVEPLDQRAMMMVVGTNGAHWMKYYDMGSQGTVRTESILDMDTISEGHILCSGNAHGDFFDGRGFVMKVDSTGDVVWCTKFANSSISLSVTGVVELADGTILACARAEWDVGFLLRLSGSGQLLSQKRYEPADGIPSVMDDFFRSDGDITLMTSNKLIGLDGDGNACDFVDSESIVASTSIPVVSNVLFSNSIIEPEFLPLTWEERVPQLEWTLDCSTTATLDKPQSMEPFAYWGPDGGSIQLVGTLQMTGVDRMVLYSIDGRRVRELTCCNNIDMRSEPDGVYILKLPEQKCIRIIKR